MSKDQQQPAPFVCEAPGCDARAATLAAAIDHVSEQIIIAESEGNKTAHRMTKTTEKMTATIEGELRREDPADQQRIVVALHGDRP